MYSSIAVVNSGLIFLALLAYGLLNWFGMPTGSLIDWAIGIGIFEWTILIVTVPWNIYFSARSAVQTGRESQHSGIEVDERQIRYASSIANRSLIVAIGLHIFTAAGLYYLAVNGITALGYLSSIGVLLLTLLRPAISTYEYLSQRLADMREQFAYPRADILELRDRCQQLEYRLTELGEKLDLDREDSWAKDRDRQLQSTRNEIAKLTAIVTDFKASNELEHHRLAQEAKQAISQLSVDGQFLEHARELIRFFKTA